MLRLLAVLCASLCLQGAAKAQEEASAPAPADAAATLHVYVNRIQVPVLVLSNSHEPVKPIAADRFRVSLDSGPLFHPTHIREEGRIPSRWPW